MNYIAHYNIKSSLRQLSNYIFSHLVKNIMLFLDKLGTWNTVNVNILIILDNLT